MSSSPNVHRVFIHNCRLMLSVGVHDIERKRPQSVIAHVDVEMELTEMFLNPAECDISRTIDYSALYHFLTQDIPAIGHIDLLETLADIIISHCFHDARAQRVTVRLEKPDALQDAIGGVELCRTRKP